jgi:hypothetical protein
VPIRSRSTNSVADVAAHSDPDRGISLLSRAAVLQAVAEADHLGRDVFLRRYGFRRSKTYELDVDGRRYDSKAICGAAYQYEFPNQGPLDASEFSGGEATVVRVLRRLGFHVAVIGGSSTGWAVEERILALDLYLRQGMVSDGHPEVLSLSQELVARGFHSDAGTRANFRNPNGVAMKLGNFAALDPGASVSGLSSFSAGDLATWNEYAGDTDRLAIAVAAILDRATVVEEGRAESTPYARSTDLDRVHIEKYDLVFSASNLAITVDRAEGPLVQRFASWLRHDGHEVVARHYGVERSRLRNDLADLTARRLWEAKSDVSRSAVRMAIGQLADYKRLEHLALQGNWATGVLLPREPSRDLLHLVQSVGASSAWATSRTTFHVVEPAA